MKKMDPLEAPTDLSPVLGGPLYRLYLFTRIARPPLDLVGRRAVAISLIAWLPLLLLAAVQRRAVAGSVAAPFLYDVEVHVRFLFALPLLVAGELVVHQRLAPIVRRLLEDGIVAPDTRPQLEALVASARRLRDSVSVEVLLIALIYTAGHHLWEQQHAVRAATWYATPGEAGSLYALAGYWYAYVSIPIFQLILFRWYFRVLVWWWFLWRVAHLDLRLVPTHPDRAGGLGFLGGSSLAFAPMLVAQGALLAGLIASRIFYEGATLPEFKQEIVGGVLVLVAQALAPLSVFIPQLVRAKRAGLREYGQLASRYVTAFERKWVRDAAAREEVLLAGGDIQSLADLAGSFEIVQSMRALPVGRGTVIGLVAAAALPLLPLTLTMMSVEELARKLLSVVL